jgi:hypothetical protein
MDGVVEDIHTKGVHSMSGYGPRRGFGLLGFLVGLLLLGVVAVVAYNAGLSTGAASGAASTDTTVPVVYGPGFGWGFGFGFFPIFGFLFFILILALVFRAIFRPWGGGHGWRGGYGPGWWGYRGTETRDVPPPFEPMLESWHRRMHGEKPSEPNAASTTDRPPDQKG